MGTIRALFGVAYQSLLYRLSGVALAIAAVSISVFVLLSVEHVRNEARSSFASTVSNVDLIVGARTGEINLLLLSIFRIGNPTANISWESVEEISDQPKVEWVVPISLGDSHKNFRVVGTSAEFFDRYKYGQSKPLVFDSGERFNDTLDVVVGAHVAAELTYDLGDALVLSHGMADTSFTHHDQVTFTVSGVLATTGTPVDNALFVSLEAIEAIHAEEGSEHHSEHADHKQHADHEESEHHDEHADHEQHGHHEESEHHDEHADHEQHADHEESEHHDEHADHEQHADHEESEHHDEHADHEQHGHHEESDQHHQHDHPPIGTVTAVLVGLDSAAFTLQVQRWINEFADEALLAILPGFTLAQLWSLVGGVENVLRGISILVFVSALFGLNAMMLASMRERKREIEILRSIGAPSRFIVALLIIESMLIVTVGIILAVTGLLCAIALANNLLASELGLALSLQIFYPSSMIALGLIYLTTLILSLVPAWKAYAVARSYSSG
jgi:putative ABC transport system permease protein